METKPPTITIKDNRVLIDAPLQAPTISSTGKTLIVCQLATPYLDNLKVNGQPVRVQLNAFIKNTSFAGAAPSSATVPTRGQ